MISFLAGKTRIMRTVENGVFSFPEIRIEKESINGGYIPWASPSVINPGQTKAEELTNIQMLAAIGETFETPFSPSTSGTTSINYPTTSPTNELTGVILSSRKGFFRISIWCRSSSNEKKEEIMNIGRHFKYGVLGVRQGSKLGGDRGGLATDVGWETHKDSQKKGGGKSPGWVV
jgi:hypothetical protein